MMLVGLSGYAQSGKDTLGAALVKNHGFTRYAFADVLKEVLYQLNPIVTSEMVTDSMTADDPEPYLVTRRLRDIVDVHGWEMAKRVWEVRRLLQILGTEAGRDVLGENIWVDTVLNSATSTDVVITDCRFPNEAKAVKDRGGYVVRVTRPGVLAANDHPSETSLDDWPFDLTIVNGSPLEHIDALVADLYESLESDYMGLRLF